jgi:hypothetical protein
LGRQQPLPPTRAEDVPPPPPLLHRSRPDFVKTGRWEVFDAPATKDERAEGGTTVVVGTGEHSQDPEPAASLFKKPQTNSVAAAVHHERRQARGTTSSLALLASTRENLLLDNASLFMEPGLPPTTPVAHHERSQRGRRRYTKSPLADDEDELLHNLTTKTTPKKLRGHTPLPPLLRPATPAEGRGRGAAEFTVTWTTSSSKYYRGRG